VAKLVADRLGILFVDTGAMYRAVGLYAKRKGVDWHDEREVVKLLPEIEIELEPPTQKKRDGRNVTVYLNGKDVSWEIRQPEMGEGASVVSQYGEVREKLVESQQEMAIGRSVIMEGRDIGLRVLPEANLKIYMDASVEERARRKQKQFSPKGEEITIEAAKKDVMTRDNREMNREIDPLRPAEGAWILDTTGLTIEQVVEKIVRKAS
jgi:cytidylate kinase